MTMIQITKISQAHLTVTIIPSAGCTFVTTAKRVSDLSDMPVALQSRMSEWKTLILREMLMLAVCAEVIVVAQF